MTLSKATTGRVPSNVDGIFGPSKEWCDAHNAARGLVDPVIPTLPEVHREPLGSITTIEQYWAACDAGDGASEDARLWRLYGGPVGGVSNIDPETPTWVWENFGKGLDDVQLEGETLAKPGPWYTLSGLRKRPKPGWLIDGVVPQGRIVYIAGRGGTLKSFTWIDMAISILTGRPWHGREVEFLGHGRVAALVGEGGDAMIDRFDAALQHHEVFHDEEIETGQLNMETGASILQRTGRVASGLSPLQEKNLLLHDGMIDLYAGGAEFDALLLKLGQFEPDLFVVDTLALAAGRGDQNSATDMSVITGRIRQLKAAAGPQCTVLVIAHTGKSGDEIRGSSAIPDNADAVLTCKRDENQLRIFVEKMKDGPDKFWLDPLRAVRVGNSLALSDKAPDVVWSSSSLDNRIAAVLKDTTETGTKTRNDIQQLLNSDGHEPVSRYFETKLNDMVAEGRVIANKDGRTYRYEINPAWTPPAAAPTTYVPEED